MRYQFYVIIKVLFSFWMKRESKLFWCSVYITLDAGAAGVIVGQPFDTVKVCSLYILFFYYLGFSETHFEEWKHIGDGAVILNYTEIDFFTSILLFIY